MSYTDSLIWLKLCRLIKTVAEPACLILFDYLLVASVMKYQIYITKLLLDGLAQYRIWLVGIFTYLWG